MNRTTRFLLTGAGVMGAVSGMYFWLRAAPDDAPTGITPPIVVVTAASSAVPAAPVALTPMPEHMPDSTELLHVFDGSNDGPYLIDDQTRPWELQIIASSSRYLLVKIPQHTEDGDVYGVYDINTKRVTSALGAGPYVVTAGSVTYFVTGDAVLTYRAGDGSISTIEKSHNLGENETYQQSTTLYTTPSIRSFDSQGITLDVFSQTSSSDSDGSPPNIFLRTVHIEAPEVNPTCASQGGCFQ